MAALAAVQTVSVHAAAPFAMSQAPGPIRATQATLNAMVVPQGAPTTAWFEWGTDLSYDSVTTPAEIGTGSATIRVTAPVENLSPGGVYHYRVVASNSAGLVTGADQVFTTGMKVAMWSDMMGRFLPISGLTNLVSIACGHNHFLAVRNDGTAVAWGLKRSSSNSGQTNTPAGLTNVVAVAGGYSHSLALKEDGSVVAWGKYASGLAATVPANVTNVIAIAAGDWHNLALTKDGKTIVWGDKSASSYGQFSIPTGLSNVVAITCGSSCSLALKADGTVLGWGRILSSSITPPTGLTNVVAISSESWRILALRSDGSAVGWGYSGYNDTATPESLHDVTAIATGFQYSLAVTNGGRVTLWGRPDGALSIDLSALRDVIAIASGDYQALALTPVNLAPFYTSSATCVVNRDSTLAPLSDPNGDPLWMTITSLPTNGILYQYTATGRGAPILNTDTVVEDPMGRVIFAPDPNAFDPDTFAFKGTDGEFTLSQPMTIKFMVPSPVLQPLGFVQGNPSGYGFTFAGVPNRNYRFQYSSDLTNWTSSPVTPSASGDFTVIDPGSSNTPGRFYRITTP